MLTNHLQPLYYCLPKFVFFARHCLKNCYFCHQKCVPPILSRIVSQVRKCVLEKSRCLGCPAPLLLHSIVKAHQYTHFEYHCAHTLRETPQSVWKVDCSLLSTFVSETMMPSSRF